MQAELKMLEDYHVDSVWDIWCTHAVDEAMGAHMEIPDDDAPWIHEPIIHSKDDIAKLKVVEPYQDSRLPYMLEVIRRLRKAVGTDVRFLLGPPRLFGQHACCVVVPNCIWMLSLNHNW